MVNVGVVLVTTSLLVLTGLGVMGPVRTLLALVFVTFVPGWALLALVDLATPATRAALAVALSFTVCSAGALAMVWLGHWRPNLLLEVLGAASVVAILTSLEGRST